MTPQQWQAGHDFLTTVFMAAFALMFLGGIFVVTQYDRRRKRQTRRIYEAWHPTCNVRIVRAQPFDWATLEELA